MAAQIFANGLEFSASWSSVAQELPACARSSFADIEGFDRS
jgi:hypothetical protein